MHYMKGCSLTCQNLWWPMRSCIIIMIFDDPYSWEHLHFWATLDNITFISCWFLVLPWLLPGMKFGSPLGNIRSKMPNLSSLSKIALRMSPTSITGNSKNLGWASGMSGIDLRFLILHGLSPLDTVRMVIFRINKKTGLICIFFFYFCF